MKFMKTLSMCVAVAGLLGATAIADDPMQLLDFYYVENTSDLDTLCIEAGPEATGQVCTVWEFTGPTTRFAAATIAIYPGSNIVVVQDVGAVKYAVNGPGVVTKYINPGVN